MTGTPIVGKKRMQLNMPMYPIPKIDIMKTVPDTLVPLLWIEEVRRNIVFKVITFHFINKSLFMPKKVVGPHTAQISV